MIEPLITLLHAVGHAGRYGGISRLLEKLTREQSLGVDDVRAVLAAGATPPQIEDALAVSLAFNTINRLAHAFAFSVPGPKAFEAGAKFLLARGYP